MAEDIGFHCGSVFWDSDVSWNTTSPDLSPCFQKTVLVWLPCALLWLLSPVDVYYIVTSRNKNIPWTTLNIAKIVICVLLALTCLADIGHAVSLSSRYEVPAVEYSAPLIKLASLILAVVLIIQGKRKGIRNSGTLFGFWFLLFLCGAITYRTHLMNALDNEKMEDEFFFTTYMIFYPLVAAEFVLAFFVDAKPGIQADEYDEKQCPELSASFPSRMMFTWFSSLAILGFKKPLQMPDLWSLNPEDKSKNLIPKFLKHYERNKWRGAGSSVAPGSKASYQTDSGSVAFTGMSRPQQSSLLKALWKTNGVEFMQGAAFKLVSDLLTFASPILLEYLIGFAKNKDEPMWRGYLYAALMFLAAILQSVFLAQYFQLMTVVGMRMRTAIIAAVYRKSLKLSSDARRGATVGEIVNLMSVDAQRFMDLTMYINMMWSAPLQIALCLYLLWGTLGASVLAGLGIMILLIPMNGVIANMMKKFQLKQMKLKDQRIKLMNEILNGIKVLKLYAWEPSFSKQVEEVRGKEIHVLRQAAYLTSITSFIWISAPFMVALASFTAYVMTDVENILDSSTAFVSLALFNIIRFPMQLLPMMIIGLIQASVSLKRMNKYLSSEELDPNSITKSHNEGVPITVENGSFAWSSEGESQLKNINVEIKEGSLVAVVGTVGCGKTSLLCAILGDMEKKEGKVNIRGKVAYVAQQAWIRNVTVKENILFGRPFTASQYTNILEACSLTSDLEILPAGDETEIGEKGINLSGGQKQRVSLARAVYNDADIYMLDDPLSAVDSHVGKHIFEKVIGPQGILKNKTRILVTHGITYLPFTDKIIVMKEGSISEVGSYQELLDRKGAFADFLTTYLQEVGEAEEDVAGLEEMKDELMAKIGSPELERQLSRQLSRQMSRSNQSDEETAHSRSPSAKRGSSVDLEFKRQSSKLDQEIRKGSLKPKAAGDATLVTVESVETGGVKLKVYWYYVQACGVFMTSLTLFTNILSQVCSVGSNIWLSQWSTDPPSVNGTQDIELRNLRLGVYGGLGVGQALAVMIGAVTLALCSIKGSNLLHNLMLGNVLRSPMSFFDTTPLGRIVNRFAKDVDVLDVMIPMNIRSFLMCIFQVISTVVVISMGNPYFLMVILPISVLYLFIQKMYVSTSRQLKRLESTTRSPIYSHFSETLSGASTIRAYNKELEFIRDNETKVDENQICYYPSIIANRWLGIHLELTGNLIILSAALFAVIGRNDMDPGMVGLTVSYALSVTATLNWAVRMSGELETNVVAVERIKEYTETPTEAEWDIPDRKPKPDWPDQGTIVFDKYSTRYREGLDLVVKDITCEVKSGEKVGIVGRTGAGKSSLTLALFRIVEAASGKILVDGLDVSRMGLHDLRSRITIIPQDPVLFSGTLRINLDPFNVRTDDDIWRALEVSHLKSYVSALQNGLDYEVAEGGENLSVGQRQLVCLARALLRKTKVLVLDEATAAVDLETDDLIQRTIRKEFADSTVLTIAHRLNTIMDSTNVMVLDKGIIKEYDSPENLLKNKNSLFYGMAKDAGLVA